MRINNTDNSSNRMPLAMEVFDRQALRCSLPIGTYLRAFSVA